MHAQSQNARKRLLSLAAAAIGLSLAGCSTVDSRVASRPEVYAASPAEVQRKILAGEVDVGFTRDQVRLALGDPNGVARRLTENGEEEVWSYLRRGPRFGIGVGVGAGTGHSSVGAGIGVGGGVADEEPRLRVFFRGDVVTAVEKARKA